MDHLAVTSPHHHNLLHSEPTPSACFLSLSSFQNAIFSLDKFDFILAKRYISGTELWSSPPVVAAEPEMGAKAIQPDVSDVKRGESDGEFAFT